MLPCIISEAGDNLKSYVALCDSCYVVCICISFCVFLRVVMCLITSVGAELVL
jgi:hypothetical protein